MLQLKEITGWPVEITDKTDGQLASWPVEVALNIPEILQAILEYAAEDVFTRPPARVWREVAAYLLRGRPTIYMLTRELGSTFPDKYDWNFISKWIWLEEEDIVLFKGMLDRTRISKYQELSPEFMITHKDWLDWDRLNAFQAALPPAAREIIANLEEEAYQYYRYWQRHGHSGHPVYKYSPDGHFLMNYAWEDLVAVRDAVFSKEPSEYVWPRK